MFSENFDNYKQVSKEGFQNQNNTYKALQDDLQKLARTVGSQTSECEKLER